MAAHFKGVAGPASSPPVPAFQVRSEIKKSEKVGLAVICDFRHEKVDASRPTLVIADAAAATGRAAGIAIGQPSGHCGRLER